MGKLILNPDYNLYEKNGQPFCDSLQIAQTFGKEHYNVLRDIKNLDCSDDFCQLNFELRNFTNRGKKYPMYLLTKDGFMFLVMGYNGKKAAMFKEAYINRFNDMEHFIKSLNDAKLEYPALTDAVMNAYDEPKHYHFCNEINMINRIVIGKTASQLKKEKGLPDDAASIRPYLTDEQITAIYDLQRADIGLLLAKLDYQHRKQILTTHHQNKYAKYIA